MRQGSSALLAIALSAGLAAGGDRLGRIRTEPKGVKAVHGYVYCNGLTGERVISSPDAGPVRGRGAGWAWGSSSADPCWPSSAGPDSDQVFWTKALHSAELAGLDPTDPAAIGAWGDWMETPGDAIITLISFAMWTSVLDPEEDGVEGQDMILVFTENDRAPERSRAVASTAIMFTDLNGAKDANGDGLVDADESKIWIYLFDLAGGDTPFDIEIGDTNGVYDGNYPGAGLFGVPGTDIDGDGLIDSGYVMAWRQPNVAEGDQLIDRFPELAGLGLENPDGLDLATWPNIVDVGPVIANPASNAGVDGDWDCYDPNSWEWPQVPGCDDQVPFPLGSWDAYSLIDAHGDEAGVYWFGGFVCTDMYPPHYSIPWANPMIGFNLDLNGPHAEPCDLNGDGLADLADIELFITSFLAGDQLADINGDGLLDLDDITYFIIAFLSGCP
ncbi:MAG: hypothetical protein H6810_12160 [Phycisphaeraceae bacterium]|nr:MAG: hypothetical protein H6810_12160 [Phycisphaeraceae bacterium]